ncbi:hypothetical protein [Nonomuraea sp. NPDC049709]|uniref:hypothetical protein n=1 Tax=Nonomuraea sp. NPDC049709 TaxID=3154736 RepID=UPI00342B5686
MSAMCDYYLAPDRATATVRPTAVRDRSKPLRGAPVFDVVEITWVDPSGSLGSLVAAIKNVPFSDDLVETVTLYPPPEGVPETEEEWLALPEDSPYLDGPQIDELPASARDVLAEIEDSRLLEVVRRWTMDPLCPSCDGDDVLDLVQELVALAKAGQGERRIALLLVDPGLAIHY